MTVVPCVSDLGIPNRTVGIGATLSALVKYLSRRRRLLPSFSLATRIDVYFTNDQLGGPGIMYPNGVSHMVEPDHLRAVKSAIDWLSYVSSVRGGLLPITDIRGVDEIGRPIGFMPSSGTPFDRRGCCSLVVLTTMVAGSAGSLTKESSRRASLDGQRLSLLAEPVLEASPWVLLLPKKDDRSSEACRSCGREGFGGCRSRSRMRVVSQQSLQDCPGHQ